MQGMLCLPKETGMKRTIFVFAAFVVTVAALGAQETRQPNPFQGTSNPPPDDTITTAAPEAPPALKPSPSVPMYAQPNPSVQPQPIAQPIPQSAPAVSSQNYAPGIADGTDDGIVQVAPGAPDQPALNQRAPMSDPDGDIVHPGPLPPGQLGEGVAIRVHLLDRLSTADSRSGDKFRARVASDVIQNGQILIPADAEIEGTVVSVSSGRTGGHGSMHLRPETVILPDGSRFRIFAQLSGAPGSSTRVNGEGGVTPGSQLKKDGIEYGGAVGAGAITGAILGGPGGALAGTIIGASAITVHLLVSHPQATLDSGTVLLFTLNEPLNLVKATQTGN
jgi:hypothetical protein